LLVPLTMGVVGCWWLGICIKSMQTH